MNKYTKWIVGTLCAASLATSAFAADTVAASPDANVTLASQVDDSWVISIGGVGATETTGESDTAFGVDFSVGRYGQLITPIEFGVRQSVSYDGEDTLLSTRLYNDWTLFTIKKVNVDVFVGGNVGLTYGNTKPEWSIAPEGGLRWWVKPDVAILARAEAPFDLEGWEFRDTVRYFLGFQVKF